MRKHRPIRQFYQQIPSQKAVTNYYSRIPIIIIHIVLFKIVQYVENSILQVTSIVFKI